MSLSRDKAMQLIVESAAITEVEPAGAPEEEGKLTHRKAGDDECFDPNGCGTD